MQRKRQKNLRPTPAGMLVAWCGIGLASIAGVCLFAMMAVTFVDVIGRYLFRAPLQGAYELTEFLLPLMVFTALPLVTWSQSHVTTGLFDKAVKGLLLIVKRVSVNVTCALACGYVTIALHRAFAASAALGETSQLLGIPKPPIIGVAAAMSGVATVLLVVLAAVAFGSTRDVRRDSPR